MSPLSDTDVRELRGVLSRLVAGVCPTWMASQREDLVQNALLRVLEVLRVDEDKQVANRSYLRRVAYSVTIDEIRRRRVRPEAAVDNEVLQETAVNPRASPEREQSGREVGAAIRDCMGRLSSERRLAVFLKIQGYSLRESASLLGWKRKAVDNHRYRGLADLRRCLEEKGVDP